MKLKMEGEESLVQMAPLIDCVFLLLVFFLAASTMKRPHRRVEVQVREESVSRVPSVKSLPLLIECTTDGEKTMTYVNDQLVTKRELRERIQMTAQVDPNARVLIKADRTVIYQHVLQIIDLLKFEGLDQIEARVRK
jgi:biopolymer transport protein ExbD